MKRFLGILAFLSLLLPLLFDTSAVLAQSFVDNNTRVFELPLDTSERATQLYSSEFVSTGNEQYLNYQHDKTANLKLILKQDGDFFSGNGTIEIFKDRTPFSFSGKLATYEVADRSVYFGPLEFTIKVHDQSVPSIMALFYDPVEQSCIANITVSTLDDEKAAYLVFGEQTSTYLKLVDQLRERTMTQLSDPSNEQDQEAYSIQGDDNVSYTYKGSKYTFALTVDGYGNTSNYWLGKLDVLECAPVDIDSFSKNGYAYCRVFSNTLAVEKWAQDRLGMFCNASAAQFDIQYGRDPSENATYFNIISTGPADVSYPSTVEIFNFLAAIPGISGWYQFALNALLNIFPATTAGISNQVVQYAPSTGFKWIVNKRFETDTKSSNYSNSNYSTTPPNDNTNGGISAHFGYYEDISGITKLQAKATITYLVVDLTGPYVSFWKTGTMQVNTQVNMGT